MNFIVLISFVAMSLRYLTVAGIFIEPIVKTDLGDYRGTVMDSRLGNSFYAFRGIRYAEAPVGELRFRPPVPVKPFDTVFEATNDGPICPQPSNLPIVEDCLWLNVFTRNHSKEAKSAVMVFIHGGAFFIGSAASWLIGPEFLMDRENIVLVSINYRLGIFGFMSTGTEECPGNNGFKDQVLALRWIRDNIENFGGDPNSVTVFGQSSGAMSVTLLTVSPMSQGLFHRAILMSGAATAQWKIRPDQIYLVARLAHYLNCSGETISEIIECFRQTSTFDLANSFHILQQFSFYPILTWLPVIEPDFGQERFLIEDPIITLKSGNFKKIPIIAGVTETELANLALGILSEELYLNEMNTNWNVVAPITFMYEQGTENSKNISEILKVVYMNGITMKENNESLKSLEMIFSDGIINFGVHRFVHLASNWTDVFYYKNSYKGRFSQFYYPYEEPYGVSHGDDLLQLFYVPAFSIMFTRDDPEHAAVEQMTRMWTNFAINGNPNNELDEYIGNVTWTPFNIEDQNYLNIGNGNATAMKKRLFLERMLIWEVLFPF